VDKKNPASAGFNQKLRGNEASVLPHFAPSRGPRDKPQTGGAPVWASAAGLHVIRPASLANPYGTTKKKAFRRETMGFPVL